MTKKIIALALAGLMILGVLPVTAFAGDTAEIWWGADGGEFYLAAAAETLPDIAFYGCFEADRVFTFAGERAWDGVAGEITSVKVLEKISPVSAAYWFSGFYNAAEFDIAKLDFSAAEDISYMFSGCSGLTDIDLSGIETPALTKATGLFANCGELEVADISGLDFAKADKAGSVFRYCSELTSVTLPETAFAENASLSGFFEGCAALETVDVSGFDTANVADMSYMFNGCNALTQINGIDGFDTAKVTKMNAMFNYCRSLTAAPVSAFDTANVTDMSCMFQGCTSLGELDLSNFNTAKVDNFDSMFTGCTGLKTLDVSSFDISNARDVYAVRNMFVNCSGLSFLDLSSFDFDGKDGYSLYLPETSGSNATLVMLNTPLNYPESTYLGQGWVDESGNEMTYLPQNLGYSVKLMKADSVCTVSFDANGGSGTMDKIFVAKADAENFALPVCTFTSPDGKTFKGWAYSADGEVITDAEAELTGDITLYAIWQDTTPEDPADPEDPEVCPYCHRVHKYFFTDIFCFITRILKAVFTFVR